MEPERTGRYPFQNGNVQMPVSSAWLTVSEAVLRCIDLGLPRTPKTIRKWAARSHLAPENADISVRREDTENGFRWSVEATSLDRKIYEELEFEARKSSEQERTSANISKPVPLRNSAENLSEPAPNLSEPVLTGDHAKGTVKGVEDELRAQLKHTQEEVLFLRDELKHRRKTDEALGSVIEAFRLNSETSKSKMLDVKSEPQRTEWGRKPRHDIVQFD